MTGDLIALTIAELRPEQRIPRGTLLGTALMTRETVTVKRVFDADYGKKGLTLFGIGSLFLDADFLIKAYPLEDDYDDLD
jgi:hypothetical protein